MATSNLSLTVLTLQPLAPCFFRSVSQSSDVSKRGIGGFLDPELWPRAGMKHRKEGRGTRESFSALLSSASLCSSRFFTLSYPKAPSLTSLAQGYPCILLGLTALSSSSDNGHGHLWRKGHPSLLAQTEEVKRRTLVPCVAQLPLPPIGNREYRPKEGSVRKWWGLGLGERTHPEPQNHGMSILGGISETISSCFSKEEAVILLLIGSAGLELRPLTLITVSSILAF